LGWNKVGMQPYLPIDSRSGKFCPLYHWTCEKGKFGGEQSLGTNCPGQLFPFKKLDEAKPVRFGGRIKKARVLIEGRAGCRSVERICRAKESAR